MSDEKIVQALRELFVTWLESRPSFRTTVEVDAAWEGWKANTAVAAMLATHESRAQPASVADLSRAAEPVSFRWYDGKCWSKWMDAALHNDLIRVLKQDGKKIEYAYTRPPEPARDACTWVEDSDYGTWDTKCGNRFVLNEGTPAENHMRHCCYCGHELEEIPYSEDAAMAQEPGDE